MTEQKENERQPEGRYLTPFQKELLQKSLSKESSQQYQQRIRIMLLADEGQTQGEICRILNCAPATVRHWVLIARTGRAHQWKDEPVGRPKRVNEQYLERLKQLVNQNPQDYGYAFRRWTGNWLCRHLAEELGIKVHERHISRLLKEMGLSTRPQPQIAENPAEPTQKSRIRIYNLSPVELCHESTPSKYDIFHNF
jgi:transposase